MLCTGTAVAADTGRTITLKLWRVPDVSAPTAEARASARIIELYRQQHPNVILRRTTGIQIPQISAESSVLMAIAGGMG